jgi:hypothetical protein
MGMMIRVKCPTCEVAEEEDVGVGMMGTGTALVVCEHCRRFVRKQLNEFADRPVEPPYRCPYCRRVTTEVLPDDADPAPCPNCRSPLRVEVVGMWD